MADFYQSILVYVESIHQLKDQVTSHNFRKTCGFSPFFLQFAKQTCVSFLVVYGPRLCTTVRSWFIHENLRQLDFFGRYITLFKQEILMLLVIISKHQVKLTNLLTFSVAALTSGISLLVWVLNGVSVCISCHFCGPFVSVCDHVTVVQFVVHEIGETFVVREKSLEINNFLSSWFVYKWLFKKLIFPTQIFSK